MGIIYIYIYTIQWAPYKIKYIWILNDVYKMTHSQKKLFWIWVSTICNIIYEINYII